MASPNSTQDPSFFTALPSIFEKASDRTGLEPRFIRVGGHSIKIQFAGQALIEKLFPALEHLSCEAVPSPDLTISVWDSASTGITMPAPPWKKGDYLERGEIRGYQSGSIRAYYFLGADALNVLRPETGQGYFWVRNAADVPVYMSAAPFLSIFSDWFEPKEFRFIHAGAIGYPDGAVLITGKGGSGKSTACLSCLDSDLFYLSDDYTLYGLEGGPEVFGLYGSGKKNTDDLARLPFLSARTIDADGRDGEKSLFFLNKHFPGKLLPVSPLKALFVVRVSPGEGTTLTPAPPQAAFLASAPSSVLQLSGAGEGAFRSLARLVRELPCYYLNVGSDIRRIPQTISRFLKHGELS